MAKRKVRSRRRDKRRKRVRKQPREKKLTKAQGLRFDSIMGEDDPPGERAP